MSSPGSLQPPEAPPPLHLTPLPPGPPPPPGRVLCTVLVTIPWAGKPSLIKFHLIDKNTCYRRVIFCHNHITQMRMCYDHDTQSTIIFSGISQITWPAPHVHMTIQLFNVAKKKNYTCTEEWFFCHVSQIRMWYDHDIQNTTCKNIFSQFTNHLTCHTCAHDYTTVLNCKEHMYRRVIFCHVSQIRMWYDHDIQNTTCKNIFSQFTNHLTCHTCAHDYTTVLNFMCTCVAGQVICKLWENIFTSSILDVMVIPHPYLRYMTNCKEQKYMYRRVIFCHVSQIRMWYDPQILSTTCKNIFFTISQIIWPAPHVHRTIQLF